MADPDQQTQARHALEWLNLLRRLEKTLSACRVHVREPDYRYAQHNFDALQRDVQGLVSDVQEQLLRTAQRHPAGKATLIWTRVDKHEVTHLEHHHGCRCDACVKEREERRARIA